MGDELATVLRLVAEGKLSAEEAAPIIEALTARRDRPEPGPGPHFRPGPKGLQFHAGDEGRGRRVRIQVNERGRRVVDVRVPLRLAAFAATMVPGIPDTYAALIEQAVESGTAGTIVDAEDENGDGVLISME